MPQFKIKQPCNDCPFRVKAAPGWLGNSSPEEFLEQTLSTQHCTTADALPCHKTIDYEKDDWREAQLPEAAVCAGSLIFLNNYMVMPYERDMIAACEAVGTSDDVLAGPVAFLTHHTWREIEDPQSEWMLIGPHILVKYDNQFIDHREVPRDRHARHKA